MRTNGGLANFQYPGEDGLCRTMTFSRGAQTPDDTMVPWLDHVHPYNFQTASRATLQFPDYITCSSPVPWLIT